MHEDDLRAAIEKERHEREALVDRLLDELAGTADPVLAALAESVRASFVRERRLRRILVAEIAG